MKVGCVCGWRGPEGRRKVGVATRSCIFILGRIAQARPACTRPLSTADCAWLQVDVEGFEPQVLQGSKQLLLEVGGCRHSWGATPKPTPIC
jgi:hypothetical protein